MSTQVLNQYAAFGSLLIAGQGMATLLLVCSTHLERNEQKYFLSAYILLNIITFILGYLGLHGYKASSAVAPLIMVLFQIKIFEGVFFYFYVRTLVKHKHAFVSQDLYMLAPALAYITLQYCLPKFAVNEYVRHAYIPLYYCVLSAYLVAALRLLPGHRELKRYNFAFLRQNTLGWLYLLILIYLGSSLFLFVEKMGYMWAQVHDHRADRFFLTNTFAFLFNFYLIAKGFRQSPPKPVSPPISEPSNASPTPNVGNMNGRSRPRYATSRLDQTQCESIWRRLESHVLRQEPFTHDSLTLAQLAGEIGVQSHQLTQVLNTVAKQSFYEYVNAYRAEKARKLIETDTEKTMIEIGSEAGFANKPTFYKHFKRRFGSTPLNYRKSITN